MTFLVSNYSFGQINLEDLKVDTTITGFHFAADFNGMKVFTKNGSSDMQTTNPTAFSFFIDSHMTAITAKEQFEMLLKMSELNGLNISDVLKKDTILKGNDAYYLSYTETDISRNYKNVVFNAFVIKDGTLILFTSGDLDKGKYFDKFRKTFYSIKL